MNENPKKNNYKISNIKKALKLYNVSDTDIEEFIMLFKKKKTKQKLEVSSDADKD